MAVANGQRARPNGTGPTNKDEEVCSRVKGDQLISLGAAVEKLKTSSPSTVDLPELKTTPTHTVLIDPAGGQYHKPGKSVRGQDNKDPPKVDPLEVWEDSMTCAVCYELYTEPVTLSCGHNFCKHCLDRIVAAAGKAAMCPMRCGSITKPFKVNTSLRDIVIAYQQHQEEVAKPKPQEEVAKPKPSTEDPRLWHSDFVKMPFCKKCQMLAANEVRTKWDMICKALNKPMRDFNDLKDAILSYNDRLQWNFDGLQVFLKDHLDKKTRDDFFHNVLPKMTKLALQLPNLCGQPIPLLRKGVAHSITLSQEQAACLLANAFFCTFPANNRDHKGSNTAEFNFNRLYRAGTLQVTHEKLKSLFHYFKTVTEHMPQGNITYSRQVVTQDKLPKWEKCRNVLPQLHVSSRGTIEDDGEGMLQVDFISKHIGGVDRVRFVICPELLVSQLFAEVLESNEAIVITGSQRYSKYTGYAKSFKWDGGYDGQTPRDGWGRHCTQLVAIDALVFDNHSNQFETSNVMRELNKAYVGFYDPYNQPHRTAVATGNWGCGAFGGDHRLKALIQLMAAAVAEREVCYFTFKDNKLTQDIYDIHQLITDHGLTVGHLWKYIHDYNAYRNSSHGSTSKGYGANTRGNASAHSSKHKNMFDFIREQMKQMKSSQPMATPHPTPSSGVTHPKGWTN